MDVTLLSKDTNCSDKKSIQKTIIFVCRAPQLREMITLAALDIPRTDFPLRALDMDWIFRRNTERKYLAS